MQNHDALEVILLRWSESSSGGRTVTFLLPNDGDVHPFRGLKDGKTGQRFGMALAFINDDEKLEPAPLDIHKVDNFLYGDESKKKAISLAQRIGMVCNKPDFAYFLNRKDPNGWDGCLSAQMEKTGHPMPFEKAAAMFVRLYCHVESRAEIKYDTPEAEKWKELYSEYQDWLGER